jgi:phosphoenolpyruvate synthase/pyruvate phosphate dikinase
MTKWVYTFGGGEAEGNAGDRDLLGGKGANLAEMCNLGLPVPPGLTIITEACGWYYANGRSIPEELKAQVSAGIDHAGDHRPRVRRYRAAAAGVGAFRCPRLDAGHDGHRAQSRPQ